MQKSIKFTISIILFMLIYGLIGATKLIIDINVIYLYVINPIVWIALAFSLKLFIPQMYEKKKLKKDIMTYILIAGLSYIIINIISGFFVTFGKNPYSTTIKGYIINFWITLSVIIAKEYIRYKLINNVYDKNKAFIAFLIGIVYVILDFQIFKFIYANNISSFMIIKQVVQIVIPSIVKNILYSYIAMYSNYLPCIIYEFLTNTFLWSSPVLPNSPWIITVMLDAVIPIIVFMYIRYTKLQKDLFKSRESLRFSNPGNIIPIVIVVILVIWVALGIFPIAPIAIASKSMEPEFNMGDVTIIKKCNPNDVIVGDVIQYQMEGYTVVHRVVEKKQNNGEVLFTTKGDNNNVPDAHTVSEDQLIGKAIFRIKYIGYPAIWLNLIQTENLNVGVETGK